MTTYFVKTTLEDLIAAERAGQIEFERITVATSDGLTIADLRVRFERVQNASNWKLPIDHTFDEISVDERRATAKAVEFFTGSKVEWWRVNAKSWRAQAAGYYSAIGA